MLFWSAHRNWALTTSGTGSARDKAAAAKKDKNNNTNKMDRSRRDVIDEEVEDQITSVSSYLKALKSNPGGLSFPTGGATGRLYFWAPGSGDPHFDNVTRRHGYSWRSSRFCEWRRGSSVIFDRFVLEEKGAFGFLGGRPQPRSKSPPKKSK